MILINKIIYIVIDNVNKIYFDTIKQNKKIK